MSAHPDPDKVYELFHAAKPLSLVERRRYLDQQELDPAVRQKVERLLAAHDANQPPSPPRPDGDGDPSTVNPAEAPLVPLPARIGRYRVLNTLGEGSFGIVYLAQDEQLQRLVAIKVPHHRLVSRPEDAEPYLAEARTVAGLDHPNIVPVYDVGNCEDFPCYVVSKFIEGSTLARKIQQGRLPFAEAAQLAETVAEALAYAHRNKLVHRDIKPGNILLDGSGKPYVADFGLALREENLGRGPGCAGTPAYMSPEQARGEGNRVNGQSDIFSLGVVLYELLTGRRPFDATAIGKLLEQITSWENSSPSAIGRRHPKGAGTDLPESLVETGLGPIHRGRGHGRRLAALP